MPCLQPITARDIQGTQDINQKYIGVYMITRRYSSDRSRWIVDFLSISTPFIAILVYAFFVSGKTYNDNTSAERVYYMVSTSLGWEFSKWPPLLATASYGFLETFRPSIPEIQLAALYGYVSGWPRDNLSGFAIFGVAVMLAVIVIAAAWGASINKTLNMPSRLIFVSATLIATQPSMLVYFWSSYYHYIVFLL